MPSGFSRPDNGLPLQQGNYYSENSWRWYIFSTNTNSLYHGNYVFGAYYRCVMNQTMYNAYNDVVTQFRARYNDPTDQYTKHWDLCEVINSHYCLVRDYGSNPWVPPNGDVVNTTNGHHNSYHYSDSLLFFTQSILNSHSLSWLENVNVRNACADHIEKGYCRTNVHNIHRYWMDFSGNSAHGVTNTPNPSISGSGGYQIGTYWNTYGA